VGVLVGVEGEEEGELYAIRNGENTLGRSEECDVTFRSGSLKFSRQHATIVHDDGVFAIVSLKPENPTLVNGEPIEGQQLEDGDLIKMGRSALRFRTIEGP
jgi:pSer/pThr/pTyr-binding forkhead associated (FHA) protein